jgi:hypothetical protein
MVQPAFHTIAPMSSPTVYRFPMRRMAYVWLLRETSGAWLVLARDHGWLHGSYLAALADAQWLARNLGLPIRRVRL